MYLSALLIYLPIYLFVAVCVYVCEFKEHHINTRLDIHWFSKHQLSGMDSKMLETFLWYSAPCWHEYITHIFLQFFVLMSTFTHSPVLHPIGVLLAPYHSISKWWVNCRLEVHMVSKDIEILEDKAFTNKVHSLVLSQKCTKKFNTNQYNIALQRQVRFMDSCWWHQILTICLSQQSKHFSRY